MTSLPLRALLALSAVSLLAACGDAEPPAAEAPAAPAATQAAAPAPAPAPVDPNAALPANHPPMNNTVDLFAPPPAAPAAMGGNRGTVLAVHTAGGYTYARVQQGGRNLWLAGPATRVAAGDTVAWDDGAMMRNFTSKALGRTFDELLFVGSLVKADPAAIPASNRGRVVSMLQSGGYTYVEVDSSGRRLWIAAQTADGQVGDEVSWAGGAVMRNFSSSSLGRTFDEILFTTAISRIR